MLRRGCPPRLVYAVKPGDAITIHGLKAKATPMVMAASVSNDATGATVAGIGRGPLPQFEASGVVKAPLHTPRGDIDGVLLTDGTIIHLPPPEAQKFAALLAPGNTVFVRGFGYEGALGRVVAARSLGADKEHVQEVSGPRPPGPGGFWRRHFGMGPGGHGPMADPDDRPPPPQ